MNTTVVVPLDETALRLRLIGWLETQPAGDAAHDLGHLERVERMALAIAAGEGNFDRPALMAASLLHDCVHVPKNSPLRSQASRMAAEAAAGLLKECGVSPGSVEIACHAIAAHSYSAGITPLTVEAKALQDADRIEALGAIGIARCFAVSGALGRALFHPQDPLAIHRPLDEGIWALDHFQTKLLRLPATMQTATGRKLAEQRAGVLQAFMEQLADECLGSPEDLIT